MPAKIHVLFLISMFFIIKHPAAIASNQTDTFNIKDTVRHSWQLNVVNTLGLVRKQQLIRINLHDLNIEPDSTLQFVAMKDQNVIPSQLSDDDLDGHADSLLLVLDFSAEQHFNLVLHLLSNKTVLQNQAGSTYTEIAVRIGGSLNNKGRYQQGHYLQLNSFTLPNDHEVGNRFFKYEGIGFESEQIAYRFYFDHRSAIDIFGKRQNRLMLRNIGLDGDNYHHKNSWGMDVLKVASTPGLAAVAAFNNNKIIGINEFSKAELNLNNGPVFSEAILHHIDWQVADINTQLTSRYRIYPGPGLMQVTALATPKIPQWALVQVDHQVTRFSSKDRQANWCYSATWGKQSLADDNLGMAIFYPCILYSKILQQQDSYGVAVNDTQKPIQYYFIANWQQQPMGADKIFIFEQIVQNITARLNHPIELKLRQLY
ncbi:DUF4861 family protein [Neptunicella marina]|uniref:DUF4861 family protein n=1 Tax=Neptunicella marina TaxID=2125989 RepID=A0A8J6IVR5_9ALTE|nr:DUF4861 family protein [Neptunicella marina]MBC3766772.1 DUF4861 family protein [Neptunicella marina]